MTASAGRAADLLDTKTDTLPLKGPVAAGQLYAPTQRLGQARTVGNPTSVLWLPLAGLDGAEILMHPGNLEQHLVLGHGRVQFSRLVRRLSRLDGRIELDEQGQLFGGTARGFYGV